VAQVVWTEDSEADLRRIYDQIAVDSRTAAASLVLRLVASVSRLQDFAYSGRVVPEFGRENVRELIVGSYRVIHRVGSNRVDIARVLHGARLLQLADLEGRHD
jgi:plasmid stabilization system protein ParE